MRTLVILTAAAMMLFSVNPAVAQKGDSKEKTNTRSVQGVVTDGQENVLEGAVVQLKDTKTLSIRSFITKGDGKYHFFGLSPDIDYEVRADHQGKSSSQRTLSSFDSRKQAVMDLKVSK